ncbi:hypothetical protein HYH03_013953 [Edaphochlamys debaryana]|uniref:Uncharacterized protein n=1 Tax=Edaphochlamys debaryana TaxID=47281 RepID=A0A835XX80_9CHLO|nr:hypothetical protein HYH03_013953 [Edaphochlamys debaryana]|eukprot:KAG2487384.1 hypothetical protein HYH03_013953 [Edaphochlamys debaryana]
MPASSGGAKGHEAALGLSLERKEVLALALLHPRYTVALTQAFALTPNQLAVLGEDLARLAAVELTWTAAQELGPSARAAPGPAQPLAQQLATKVGQVLNTFKPSNGGGSSEDRESREDVELNVSAALLNRAAAALQAKWHTVVERWQVEAHMLDFGNAASGTGPSKQDKAMCARALVAVVYLDRGYAQGVRAALAPVLAAVLQDSEDPELKEVGARLAACPPASLPRAADELGPPQAGSTAALAGAGAAAGEAGTDQGPFHKVAMALLAALADAGYQPRDEGRFLALSDLWYRFLHMFLPGAYLRPFPSDPRTPDPNADIDPTPARSKASFVLGRALYGVFFTERLLEDAAEELEAAGGRRDSVSGVSIGAIGDGGAGGGAGSDEGDEAGPSASGSVGLGISPWDELASNPGRRAAAVRLREAATKALEDPTRLAAAEAGLRLTSGVLAEAPLPPGSRSPPMLARAADGVVAAAALDRGPAATRALVRHMLAATDARAVLERVGA